MTIDEILSITEPKHSDLVKSIEYFWMLAEQKDWDSINQGLVRIIESSNNASLIMSVVRGCFPFRNALQWSMILKMVNEKFQRPSLLTGLC